jgi:hypothetical protein
MTDDEFRQGLLDSKTIGEGFGLTEAARLANDWADAAKLVPEVQGAFRMFAATLAKRAEERTADVRAKVIARGSRKESP